VKRRGIKAALLGITLGWAMCLASIPTTQASASPIVVQDDRGNVLTFAVAPQRIVSLLPSLTESVCALGSCDRLVGTDRYSNSPSRVIRLPKLGGIEDANLERIVALKPDVVLAAPSTRVVERLESLGLKVVLLESKTHDDVQRSLIVLAALLGTPDAAVPLWNTIQKQVEQAAGRVPVALRGQRVYFEVDATPYAAGEGSFIGETLTRLGLANAVPAALGPFPQLNPEFVVRAQPDIVMAEQRSIDEMPGRPGWARLHALRDHRVCGFSNERYEVLVRPGPRLGDAAQLLADCLVAFGTTTR
jgi:iron complex transport system substrate-binding protein